MEGRVMRWMLIGFALALAGCTTGPAAAPPSVLESANVAETPPVPARAAIPDTPAGRFVSGWLEAYNSTDLATIEAFIKRYDRSSTAQSFIDFHKDYGRMTPVRVTASSPNAIAVLLAPERGDAFLSDVVSMDPADPFKVLDAGLVNADRPPEFAIPRVPRSALDRMMDARLAQDVADDRFSGTIMVQRHGRIIYARALGLADRAAGTPVTMDTRFRMGSANKMFTAVSILQLVAQGKLSLDGTVGTYLPDYPNAPFARTVTIRQLLSHTGRSGRYFHPRI